MLWSWKDERIYESCKCSRLQIYMYPFFWIGVWISSVIKVWFWISSFINRRLVMTFCTLTRKLIKLLQNLTGSWAVTHKLLKAIGTIDDPLISLSHCAFNPNNMSLHYIFIRSEKLSGRSWSTMFGKFLTDCDFSTPVNIIYLNVDRRIWLLKFTLCEVVDG